MNVNMLTAAWLTVLAAAWAAGSGNAHAQITSEQQTAIRTHMASLRKFYDHLPPAAQQALSGSARNLMYTAENWDEIEATLPKPEELIWRPRRKMISHSLSTATTTAVKINDADPGPGKSVMGGFTEVETSTAWCGSNIVVGSSDSGSEVEGFLAGSGGITFDGVFLSTNTGATFTDKGRLPAGSSSANFLAGAPALACKGLRFYYASLHETSTSTGAALSSDISVSISTNGGSSFGFPILAATAPASTHFLDLPWLAIDPATPSTLYVSYTDIDSSHTTCANTLTAIKVVKSTNSGTSWGTPVTVSSVCATSANSIFPFVEGAKVGVNASHVVDVAWESFSSSRQQMFAKSTNGGNSFSMPVSAATVSPVGDGDYHLQGNLRSGYEIPSMAIDHNNAKIYIFWNNGAQTVKDVLGLFGVYAYADVVVTVSGDGGATWSTPVRVNTNVEPPNTDQYQPNAAVNASGTVAVCFYDRAEDSGNYFFGRSCAESTNFGVTWTEMSVTSATSPPIHDNDYLVSADFLGLYDGLAADTSGTNGGFGGAFQTITTRGNPDPNFVTFP